MQIPLWKSCSLATPRNPLQSDSLDFLHEKVSEKIGKYLAFSGLKGLTVSQLRTVSGEKLGQGAAGEFLNSSEALLCSVESDWIQVNLECHEFSFTFYFEMKFKFNNSVSDLKAVFLVLVNEFIQGQFIYKPNNVELFKLNKDFVADHKMVSEVLDLQSKTLFSTVSSRKKVCFKGNLLANPSVTCLFERIYSKFPLAKIRNFCVQSSPRLPIIERHLDLPTPRCQCVLF